MPRQKTSKHHRAIAKPVDLLRYFNFPRRVPKDQWWQNLAATIRSGPTGEQRPWGIPFHMAEATGPRAICISRDRRKVTVPLNDRFSFLCFLHCWYQLPESMRMSEPKEGLSVAEYELVYDDGSTHAQPVRGRFEVAMAESPGPPWLAMDFHMYATVDPAKPPSDIRWGEAQPGLRLPWGRPLVYAMRNPHPRKQIASLTMRGFQESPLLVSGLTIYYGKGHPLQHLPRRTYRVSTTGKGGKVTNAEVDLGVIARVEHTLGPCDDTWLRSPYVGTQTEEPNRAGEDLLEVVGARDATVSVTLEGQERPLVFSLGKAFSQTEGSSGKDRLEVLGRHRQWMRVRVLDSSTGKPTPVRIRMVGSHGEYLAPYGHHAQVNTNWFEDYGADVVVGGRSYAYVPGEFTTDLPVGDLYVEINKGYEYEPVRRHVIVNPGQETLYLEVTRWKDLRRDGWVTADTHVHFISPQTAWLEAQAEGINVVNLLASQWGRLFTNVGDLTGRVGINQDDTIVFVGTENRNHMLGHMSMLGTQGLPVYPMCCGGPSESWVGDPDFMMLAEWARENRRKGGLVIRPHYPYCGHTEDPVPILKGLVDALEIRLDEFAIQEWYRYLNCGYRVAVVGGTDKMSAGTALGWLRTYAKIDTDEPLTYQNWADAVRAGRTVSTNGPLIDLRIEGRLIGDTICLPAGGGTVEVRSVAECSRPLARLEVVHNGSVIASQESKNGSQVLRVEDSTALRGSGWIAARCVGLPGDPGSYLAAHTSPIYVKCGDTEAFDGPAALHMLALMEGGIEYLNTLAVVFDEASRKRMIELFEDAQHELLLRFGLAASRIDGE